MVLFSIETFTDTLVSADAQTSIFIIRNVTDGFRTTVKFFASFAKTNGFHKALETLKNRIRL